MRRAVLQSVAGEGSLCALGETRLKSPKSLARSRRARSNARGPPLSRVYEMDGRACPGRYCTSTAGRWEVQLFPGILQVPTGFVLCSTGEANTVPLAW